MSVLLPADLADTAEIVTEAARNHRPLAVRGFATKKNLGRPVEAAETLDLSRISGIIFYEPEDLVLSVRAGTPIEEIDALLAAHSQELAFEPMSFGPLHGTGFGTIGGAYMTNLSGPRRIKAGAARDFVLGVKAVSGRGEIFKAGGRVVKNVTGYDLARGLTGSFGTLAVATEITMKVLPRPETSATLILPGLDAAKGVSALCAALGAPADVSGAAYLPAPVAQRQGFATAVAAMRLEGFAPSVEARFAQLAGALKQFGTAERLEEEHSRRLWAAIRDAEPLAAAPESFIWKISAAPKAGPAIAQKIAAAFPCDYFFDWSGGLIWVSLPPGSEVASDGGAGVIRQAIKDHGGGHATLFRAPAALRSRVPVFEPQPEPLAALSRRLKAEFDPLGILEPGRIWPQA